MKWKGKTCDLKFKKQNIIFPYICFWCLLHSATRFSSLPLHLLPPQVLPSHFLFSPSFFPFHPSLSSVILSLILHSSPTGSSSHHFFFLLSALFALPSSSLVLWSRFLSCSTGFPLFFSLRSLARYLRAESSACCGCLFHCQVFSVRPLTSVPVRETKGEMTQSWRYFKNPCLLLLFWFSSCESVLVSSRH